MKVVRREGGEYPDCIVKYFNFDKFGDKSREKVFFWGWKCFEDLGTKEKYKRYKHRIFLDTASPCAFLAPDDFVERASYFTKFYTICPITAEFLNDNGVNAEAVCFPYPEWEFQPLNDIITPELKRFDSIYYGQVHHKIYKSMIEAISKHNHQFLTISRHGIDEELAKLVTQFNVETKVKWATLAVSKSCVGVNLLFPRGRPDIDYYTRNYKVSDRVGKMLTSDRMPQMKTRMIESAACKTLMLLYRDEYAIIEEWFEPDKHFIYWDDHKHLEEILDDIDSNYDKYWNIVEAANTHVKQYNITNFWSKVNE
mgnify:CR=1 FL=1|tara:strand:- start:8854 stop:9786 length:933 start_codon:yes stop_codon:yes gene_type:complete